MSEAEPFLNPFLDASFLPTPTMSLLSDHTPAPSTMGTLESSINVSSAMHAELDQIYLDRMHNAVPLLHQRRYLSWSKSAVKTRSQNCLQYAVWATASLTSAQFQHLQDTLYPELKRMLASSSLFPGAGGQQLAVDVELAQAWVLTAMYEFAKTYHHEACISAGRAFRLVQLMRLHRIDPICSSNTGDVIVAEERRRVFWMAFVLEGLYSMRNSLPLVVNEHMVSGHIPPKPLHTRARWALKRTF